MSELSDAIKNMVEEKKISQELVLDTIKQTLLATYKRRYGKDDNAVVTFADDLSNVELSARKTVVEEENYYDEVTEIPLDEAQEYNEEAEVGDELLIPIDLKSFDRISVQTGKQRAQSALRDIQKDEILMEFRGKVGEIITGDVQSEKDGDLFINLGKTQGILPRKNQCHNEVYQKGDKIHCYVESVRQDEKNERNIRVVLSRVHEDFVRKLFYIYVPELVSKDPSVEIMRIVREAGFRTKVAVYPKKVEADAVGICVGLKGNRIQAIMGELNGERIDVIKWDPNPMTYIANALSPAKVMNVVVTDESKKMCVAVVDDSQLSLAIGRQGLNVRLVNRLSDWIVDVKTQAQFSQMDISRDARAAADAIFANPEDEIAQIPDAQVPEEAQEEDSGEITFDELPISPTIRAKLQYHDIYTVEEFINLTPQDLAEMDKLTANDIDEINKVINENVDIVENEVEQTEEETFECPNCGHPVSVGMTECPNCHVGLSFEEVPEEDEE